MSTDAEAWLIEQPSVSCDTSATFSPSSLTRSRISSPQVGLTWKDSASVLTDLVVGRSVVDSMKVLAAFQEMAQGRGQVQPDEEVLGDGVAFAGVARYPARVKCALLGWMAFKDAVVRADPGAEATS